MRFFCRLEAGPLCLQVLLCPAEGAAAGSFALLQHPSNLRKFIFEDFTQQEDRSLEGLKLLQQDQERFLLLDPLLGIGGEGHLFSQDRFRQPGTRVLLALSACKLELIPTETHQDRREIRFERV